MKTQSIKVQVLLTEPKATRLKIVQDESPESPRDWDNITTIAAAHHRYNIGEIQISDPIQWLEEYLELPAQFIGSEARLRELEDKFFNHVYGKRLYMYEHGVVTIKTSPYSCRWDSGQIGYVFITKEAVKKVFPDWKRVTDKRRKELDKIIEAEIAVYRDYIEGNVWGFILQDQFGDDMDSCFGYFGDPHENAEVFLANRGLTPDDVEIVIE